jgi:hypothetical protein
LGGFEVGVDEGHVLMARSLSGAIGR